jgi:signal transduction histidine kinase
MFFEDNLEKQQLQKILPYLDGMKEGVKRAANIVTSLNHFSRNNNSATEKCNIHIIIDNCLTMLNNKLKHKVEVIKNYTDLPFNLTCNDGKLHQAILNILSNAEQAIDKKGVIEITTTIEQQNLKITITDNGCGIKQNIISKISDPFFTTKEVGRGTGLGLSIAYRIIEDSNGSIKHISKEREGTKVIILLPLNTQPVNN